MISDIWLYAFLGSFMFVALKAFQQRNVVFLNWIWIVPLSMAMAWAEVKMVGAIGLQVAEQGLDSPIWIPIGLGAGLGCVSAMWLHKTFLTPKED